MNNRTTPSWILNSKHPKHVKEYKDIILKEIKQPRMKQLVDSITKQLTENTLTIKDIQTINELDTKFHKIRIDAESQLQKHKHDNEPWSPKLDQA